MSKKLTTEEWIKRAIKVHGKKYDYSKVEYKTAKTKVYIICPIHGEFPQKPHSHLDGHGCPKCSNNVKSNNEEFIEKAREVHGDKYDYSEVDYIDSKTKVCIICPKHGKFLQTPDEHLRNHGCPQCSPSAKLKKEGFIEKARKVHGDKYDYSRVEYKNANTKVIIICSEHGEFTQKPNNHLHGNGCSECNRLKKKLTTEKFIEKARKKHGDRYDYSKVKYVDCYTPVIIICSEHGEFPQKSYSHLSGRGCPKCNSSRLEIDFANFLSSNGFTESKDDNGISSKNIFIRQKKFDWLKHRKALSLDFYLPDHNIAIECQGGQHFKPVERFGGEKGYRKILKRDLKKKQLCEQNGVKVLYYADESVDIPEDWDHYHVCRSTEEILKEIKKDDQK